MQVYYDKDADIKIIREKKVRDHRLRMAARAIHPCARSCATAACLLTIVIGLPSRQRQRREGREGSVQGDGTRQGGGLGRYRHGADAG